jgi:regulator of protease activity HflC (stomatin/prohibitin superfamily)
MLPDDLNNNVISMPPLTLVTVDEGYSAVTEDNGKQRILPGGNTYLLDHRNWKFQKFISQKIQSNNLDRISATSADNVLMAVDATVIWQIDDVAIAARNSAETIRADGSDTNSNVVNNDIHKLSNDVLKQAEASLAAFIGSVNYSDTFNVATAV